MPPVLTINIDRETLTAALEAAAPIIQERGVVSRHLKARFFNLLPVAEKECPICLDSIRSVEDFELLLCGHFFHRRCWRRVENAGCAICRAQP